jgi:hypothetical protein
MDSLPANGDFSLNASTGHRPEPGALPSFTGLHVHREPSLGYSFLVPTGWCRQELLGAEGNGVFYTPTPDETFTGFSADGRDLGVEVNAADLPILKAGFVKGLRKLPGSRVTKVEADAIGRLVTMEAQQTYREGEQTRKRWVRLLYQGTVQVRLVAQGASPAEFDYWLPAFYESMRLFQFADWAVVAGIAVDDWK